MLCLFIYKLGLSLCLLLRFSYGQDYHSYDIFLWLLLLVCVCADYYNRDKRGLSVCMYKKESRSYIFARQYQKNKDFSKRKKRMAVLFFDIIHRQYNESRFFVSLEKFFKYVTVYI